MMIYLTGADNSLSKSLDNPQSDANKSLGGYISSTPVPNAALNVLFDLISDYTIEKKQKETIAIGLINQFDFAVKNVKLKIITKDDNEVIFKVAAVNASSNFQMEKISNRYQEPLNAEFFNASFYRASVELEIKNAAVKDEEIIIYPFNIVVKVTEDGIEGTWKAFEKAFSEDEIYTIKRLSENKFRIERRDEFVLETSLECSFLTSEKFDAEFLGKFENKEDNSVLIKELFNPKEAVGIWIQRQPKGNTYSTDQDLIDAYIKKQIKEDTEEVELIISYDLVENTEEQIL